MHVPNLIPLIRNLFSYYFLRKLNGIMNRKFPVKYLPQGRHSVNSHVIASLSLLPFPLFQMPYLVLISKGHPEMHIGKKGPTPCTHFVASLIKINIHLLFFHKSKEYL